jgi:hypothetical protein
MKVIVTEDVSIINVTSDEEYFNVVVTEGGDVLAEQYALLAQQAANEASVSAASAELDALATAADRIQTGLDVIATGANKNDAETAAILSTQQAILSSAARDGAEAERVICEDIRDEIQPFLREIRFDLVGTSSYYGKAPKDSLESSPVWTITKIVVDIDGTTTVTTASNVAWTDRLTVIYS